MEQEKGSAAVSGDGQKHSVQRVLESLEMLYQQVRSASRGAMGAWLDIDITMPQAKVLLTLLTDGRLRMGELASALDASLPTVTGIVDRLVEKGLVRRLDDPHDRRVVLCELSEAGRRMIGGVWDMGLRRVRELLLHMTDEELEHVDKGVRAFIRCFAFVIADPAQDRASKGER